LREERGNSYTPDFFKKTGHKSAVKLENRCPLDFLTTPSTPSQNYLPKNLEVPPSWSFTYGLQPSMDYKHKLRCFAYLALNLISFESILILIKKTKNLLFNDDAVRKMGKRFWLNMVSTILYNKSL